MLTLLWTPQGSFVALLSSFRAFFPPCSGVWPAEEILAHSVLSTPSLLTVAPKTRLRILELGSGTAGLAALSLAATRGEIDAVVTDGNQTALTYLSLNVTRNEALWAPSTVQAAFLDWGVDCTAFAAQHGQFDVILMADWCVVLELLVFPLVHQFVLSRDAQGSCGRVGDTAELDP